MDFQALLDGFYDRLVLRDFCGKIVPGLVVIASVVGGLFGVDVLKAMTAQISFLFVLPLAGFAWLLGFVLTWIGESPICKRPSLLWVSPRIDAATAAKGDGYLGEKGRGNFYPNWIKFHAIAKPFERIHAERLNIMREACGNGAIGLGVGTMVLSSGLLIRGSNAALVCTVSTMILFAAFALWQMHRKFAEYYGDFVLNAIMVRESKLGQLLEQQSNLEPPSRGRWSIPSEDQ